MVTVTLSDEYRIVIPKEIRDKLGLKAGQELEMMVIDDRIILIPVRPVTEMRGFLKGIDTGIEREGNRL